MKRQLNLFQGKIAIVTGGASGIGRALCEILCANKAIVVIGDIDMVGATSLAKTLCLSGGLAEAIYLNVTKPIVVQQAIDKVIAKYGVLDYMFNNAGVAVVGEMFDLSLEHWQQLMNINLWGVIYGTTIAYNIMRRQGYGHIVNIASMSGLLPSPTAVAYSMTKHAVVGFSESLRVEAASYGVYVSVVCPSSVDTGILNRTVVLKGKVADVFPKSTFFKPMLPRKAAFKILKEVKNNQAIIVFPFWAGKLLWWLYRISPSLVSKLSSYRIKFFRHRYHGN